MQYVLSVQYVHGTETVVHVQEVNLLDLLDLLGVVPPCFVITVSALPVCLLLQLLTVN